MAVRRETFSSHFGLLITLTGAAVGLGNVWRFPYMVGTFGGASFVIAYLASVFLVGIPALMAEWVLGRHTHKGTLGAFEKSGFPGGRFVGIFLFFAILCATAYYSNVAGWVAHYGIGYFVQLLGGQIGPAAILPPDRGFNMPSLLRQAAMTGALILACSTVLIKGLRKGIEKASRYIMPGFFIILIILIIRSVTLPGAAGGLKWYLGDLSLKIPDGPAMAAALGQAIFSLSLGGTFMVVYGSYMETSATFAGDAVFIGLADLIAGLLAGLVIFPAVFAFGLAPDCGPSLIFSTLPKTFSMMPAGQLFGLMFFGGLFLTAYLSVLSAFEVLIAGVTDNTRITRKNAVWLISGAVMLFSVPPMINFKIFIPWDLFFGSGMQTLGCLLAVIATAWCIKRSKALKELAQESGKRFPIFLYWWMRIVIPLAVLFTGVNLLLEAV